MIKIEILGMGCSKCKELARNTEDAVKELALPAKIEKVTEIDKITSYGVMMTPALRVDGIVVSVGKLMKKDEIKKILAKK